MIFPKNLAVDKHLFICLIRVADDVMLVHWNHFLSSSPQPRPVHSSGSPHHLITCASPNYSPLLNSHHLSLPLPFTADLNLSVSQILPSIVFLVPFGLLSQTQILDLGRTKWALAFVCFSFFFYMFCFLFTCARLC